MQVLLVRCQLGATDDLPQTAQRWCKASGLDLRPVRLAWSAVNRWMYLYAEPAASGSFGRGDLGGLDRLWTALCPRSVGADLSRLELVQDVRGHSQGDAPTHHYVVETDPEAGWGEEIMQWYQEEHMPGLAAVPGCIHARRFVNLDGGPRSHACYELVSEETLGSPPWLAVRGTAWSSRVRPHFTNTRRTMMRVL